MGRCLWPTEPHAAGRGKPVAGMSGDAIPEGKDSVLCRVFKPRLCPRSQRGAHSVLPGGPGASGWGLSGLPGVPSGPRPTPIPRKDRVLKTRVLAVSLVGPTVSKQVSLSLSLLPGDVPFCDQTCLRRKSLLISPHAHSCP